MRPIVGLKNGMREREMLSVYHSEAGRTRKNTTKLKLNEEEGEEEESPGPVD